MLKFPHLYNGQHIEGGILDHRVEQVYWGWNIEELIYGQLFLKGFSNVIIFWHGEGLEQ